MQHYRYAAGALGAAALLSTPAYAQSADDMALAAKRFAPPRWLLVGRTVGVVGYARGLVASSLFDVPTGAVIVVALLGGMVTA